MIGSTRSARVLHVIGVVVLAALLLIAGCASTTTEETSGTDDGVLGVEEPVATHPSLPEAERIIGLHDLGDGRVRAVGLLQYRASEGASWCLVEGTPGETPPADAQVIVVVTNMADLDAACNTSGALAYAEGELAVDDGALPGQPMVAEFVAQAD